MAKVLTFDEFMNESYGFHSYGSEVEEIEYYDSATEVFESEINSFLGIEESIFEAAEGAIKKVGKEVSKKAFQYVTKPEDLKSIKSELKTGSKGEEVKKLQSLMGVVTDSIFGSETRGGLKKWQEISGIKPIDGVFRPEDADKYVKAIKASNVEKATKEAKKIAVNAFDASDPIILKGIEEVKIIKVGANTYIIITPSKNVSEVAKEAKAKGSKGYDFLLGLASAGSVPLILVSGVAKAFYKGTKDVIKGMVGALTCLGEKTYELSCNIWAGILEFGKYIKEKGKEAWKGAVAADQKLYQGFVKACNAAASKAKDAAIATAALFTYFYDQSKKAFKGVTNFIGDVLTSTYKGITIAGKKITDNIKTAYSDSVAFLKKSAEKAKSFVKSAIQNAKDAATKTGQIAVATAQKIGNTAVSLGDKIVKKVNKFIEDQGKAFYSLLFESSEFEGEKSIFENYNVLENGELFYVPTWRLTID